MIGYILRGQSVGPMLDTVFISYPTDEDFQKALNYELERHGAVLSQEPSVAEDGTPDLNERGAPVMRTVATARERWVRVQTIEVKGITGDAPPVPASARTEMVGKLSAEKLQAIEAGANLTVGAAPGEVKAEPQPIAMGGHGRVTNPGEKMEISADEVGTISTSDFLTPSK